MQALRKLLRLAGTDAICEEADLSVAHDSWGGADWGRGPLFLPTDTEAFLLSKALCSHEDSSDPGSVPQPCPVKHKQLVISLSSTQLPDGS